MKKMLAFLISILCVISMVGCDVGQTQGVIQAMISHTLVHPKLY